ncbi:MAG: hypothetical protein WCD76_17710 [Pyrinomonadaceae bacterium]
MRTKRTWMGLALTLAVTSSGLGVSAQDKADKKSQPGERVEQREVIIRHGGPGDAAEGMKGDTFVWVSSEMSFGGKVVKNAPYSAQAVTETVQTLGDGNRIVRKNTASVYRDSEGRTRRDQEIGAIGPFASAGEPSRTAFINDPVAGINYILDPRTKTARKLPGFDFKFDTGKDKGDVKYKIELRENPDKNSAGQAKPLPPPPPAGAKMGERHEFIFGGPGQMPPPPPGGAGEMPDVQFYRHPSNADTKTEKLENRVIEGVQAEGTRTTTTIAAGEVGNEQPIVITGERWYSPELQTVVMTRHSDPRFGETTYRLTGISRNEPAATLFQVPSDYTVKEAPPMVRRMRKPAPPPEN